MGFFSGIGKALGGAVKAIGGVAKQAFPTVLSIAKNSIPGVGLATNIASKVFGGGGTDEEFTQSIQAQVRALAGGADLSGQPAYQSVRTATGVVRQKVVIFQ